MTDRVRRGAAIAVCLAIGAACPPAAAQGRRFAVTISPNAHAGALTGRLIVIVSTDSTREPRELVSPRGAAIFGIDLHQLAAGQPTIVDGRAAGFPLDLAQLPAGDYSIQAIVNVYQRVHRADGHTTWVHMNDGMVEPFEFAAGNLFSDAQRVHIGARGTFRLVVDHLNPPAPRRKDTEWLKHVSIRSAVLTKFWGHPVFINATLLLPKGYASHPHSYYPSVYPLGHDGVPFSFNPTPNAARAGGEINPTTLRRGVPINPLRGLETGHEFYDSWISDSFPRFIAITFDQQTPYFPDSYAVNSANNGPYGDALVDEVIPYLEQHFRIIRQPYARQVEGASTSGWASLALQLYHPDFFGGAWILQPDPIDFRSYQLTNIYSDTNAFSIPAGQYTTTGRPFERTTEGQVLITTRALSRYDAVLGSHERSEDQFDAWEAVYGPVGADGYPVPLWDKRTGVIDHAVAEYMRDHGFDLRYYAQEHWATLGPKLAGKLHFFCGDMDNFYLNLAVYRFQDFLNGTSNPHSDADFTFARPKKGHGWHSYTWAELIRKIAAAVKAEAPPGTDIGSWTY